MKIYKDILQGREPFVLIKRTVGRSYTWTNPDRANGREVDLSVVDAFALAKLQKLKVVLLSNPERLHVVGVLSKTEFDKEEVGIEPGFVGVSRVGGADGLDKVNRAIGGGEFLALNGCAHGNSLKKELIVEQKKVFGLNAWVTLRIKLDQYTTDEVLCKNYAAATVVILEELKNGALSVEVIPA